LTINIYSIKLHLKGWGMNLNTIVNKAYDISNDLITWRRHLHMNPELSFKEYETSKYIKETLNALGYKQIEILAKTGLVVKIQGKEKGATVALRADMDALPINDEKEVEYRSKNKNIGHLCGHDAHTSILLGVAKILSKIPLKKGEIRLIFQPAEEGFHGAKHMVDEGALGNPDVDVIAGLHVHPTVNTGEISITKGYASATADSFVIKIIGKGGHAAHPHMSIDPIAVSGEIISSLQQIVSRNINPIDPVVITIGKIEGGYAENVIAPTVEMKGTIRMLNPNLRSEIKNKMQNYILGITGGMGAKYEFNYYEGIGSVYVTESLLPTLEETADKVLGPDNFKYVKSGMGGEDFSYYTDLVPGVFFRLGIYNENKNAIYPNHHPKFDIDESALPLGVAMLAQFAFDYIDKY
jgi:amidohydrolase